MVVLTRSIRLEASASIAITTSSFILSTIPLIISPVSIPVIPNTPGAIAHTGLTPSSTSLGTYSKRCLVTISCDNVFGPKASGVTFQFPSPTTNTVDFSSKFNILSNSFAKALHVFSYKVWSFSFSLGTSSVI